MPNEKQGKPDLKVTDKRIFTAEGDIRDEFREQIRPAEPGAQRVAAMPAAEKAAPPRPAEPPRPGPKSPGHRDGRTIADKATNPETPFSNFIEPLIAQTYMSLGMLKNPYQPQAKVDPVAARQMIEILTVLQEKTKGNLIEAEDDFLTTHLGELKLAYVQRTKNL